MIVGIDEVGRGCLAGPVCVGAVVLGSSIDLIGITDSKALTAKKRELLADRIIRDAASVGIGWASARFIDKYGLTKALEVASHQALAQITAEYDEIILDGTVNFLKPKEVTLLKKADQLIGAVSAASIVAKVARDRYMGVIDERFSGYGFRAHVGYGTKAHLEAIADFGPSPIHRMSFAPLSNGPTALKGGETSGARAEHRAAIFLEQQGYKVVDQNWKTKWCEIDIIALKNDTVSFVEVKYRRNRLSGSGLEFITPKKQQQMRFAAELWLQQNPHVTQAQLAALELEGEDFTITQFIERLM